MSERFDEAMLLLGEHLPDDAELAEAQAAMPCPACGTEVQARAVECPDCGLVVRAAEGACLACGRQVAAGEEHCPACKAEIAD